MPRSSDYMMRNDVVTGRRKKVVNYLGISTTGSESASHFFRHLKAEWFPYKILPFRKFDEQEGRSRNPAKFFKSSRTKFENRTGRTLQSTVSLSCQSTIGYKVETLSPLRNSNLKSLF